MTATNLSIKDISVSVSYTKTNKLITALYMVTDIMDKEEPLRLKLRTLGIEILSDTSVSKTPFDFTKINQVLSFLDIASAMNFISEMNCNILKKEFIQLKESIQEYADTKPTWLTELFFDPKPIGHAKNTNGHQVRTRIGVQKGSTLMKALSDKTFNLSDRNNKTRSSVFNFVSRAQNFDILKKERRNNIINVIKNNGGNVAIKDIRIKINNGTTGTFTCGEKTLQRELLSMTKDGVLNKTGEKRWSKYSLKPELNSGGQAGFPLAVNP